MNVLIWFLPSMSPHMLVKNTFTDEGFLSTYHTLAFCMLPILNVCDLPTYFQALVDALCTLKGKQH